jgi:hypothetical protein
MANDEKSIIPLNVVGVHQVFTNVTVLFQTNDDGQAVFTGNYPENGQISDSIKVGRKFLNMSRLPNQKKTEKRQFTLRRNGQH